MKMQTLDMNTKKMKEHCFIITYNPTGNIYNFWAQCTNYTNLVGHILRKKINKFEFPLVGLLSIVILYSCINFGIEQMSKHTDCSEPGFSLCIYMNVEGMGKRRRELCSAALNGRFPYNLIILYNS